jgi:hypothetical protein
MNNVRLPRTFVVEHRPPGAPAHEGKSLGKSAHRWRDEMERVLTEIEAGSPGCVSSSATCAPCGAASSSAS